ncbi:MAG: type II secretion system protein [Gallionella sp.]|nr:type II secretion system protein [Gallionella sp.]MDD4960119.1 type II secretion system protein [Gallionella sp.]
MKRQTGFTLIELVMVIVILGVLAAAALPKFVNLKGEAQTATLAGVAGSLNTAIAMNYAIRGLNPASGTGTVGKSCVTIFGNLLEGGLPEPYLTGSTTANSAFPLNVFPSNTATNPKQCLLSADGVVSVVVPVVSLP